MALAAAAAVGVHGLLRGPAAPVPVRSSDGGVADAESDTPEGRARDALEAYVRSQGFLTDETETSGFIDVFRAPTLMDTFEEQRFVFVARADAAAHRDVYLLRARIAPNGVPVAIGQIYNLTRTPDGDEAWICPRPGEVAFTTRFGGLYTGVTVLNLNGAAPDPTASAEVRLTQSLTDLLETGDLRGVQVTRLVLEQPAVDLRLAWEGDLLQISRRENAGWNDVRVDLTSVRVGEGAPVDWLRAVETHRAARSLVNWAVDTARSLSFIGPERIYALESAFFRLADLVQTTRYRLFGARAATTLDSPAPAAEPPPEAAPAAKLEDPLGPWPIEKTPEDLKPRLDPPMPDEGKWHPFHFQARPTHAPPTFWVTTYRVDPERPDAITVLVLADARQVGLRMVGGTEHPRSTTGEVGTGMVPAADRPRTLAALNGGFQAIHGNYGMVVDRTVLLPPLPQVGTVAVYDDGRALFGTWPTPAAGETPGLPSHLRSLRQNLPPLLDGGVFNPLGRKTWGFTLRGSDPVITWRSGMGVTRAGRLVFAVCVRCSADTLADALAAADADYAMHLDMNISNIGFEWWRPGDAPGSIERAALFPDLWHAEEPRYVDPHTRDFFYLVRESPESVAGLDEPLSPQDLPLPPGMWPPPFSQGALKIGAARVRVLRVDGQSVGARAEPRPGTWCTLALHKGLPGERLPTSAGTDAGAGQTAAEPFDPERATLYTGADDRMHLAPPGMTPTGAVFFQQLPVLRREGRPTSVVLPGPERWLLAPDAHGALLLVGGAVTMAELNAAAARLGLAFAAAPTPSTGAPVFRCGAAEVVSGTAPLSAHLLTLGRARATPPWPAAHTDTFQDTP